ncbi:MAG: HD domain-containing phosphohydrolase [Solirubrobacterales bacterium]
MKQMHPFSPEQSPSGPDLAGPEQDPPWTLSANPLAHSPSGKPADAYRILLDTLAKSLQPFFAADAHGRVFLCNQAYHTLTGADVSDLSGDQWDLTVTAPENRSMTIETFERVHSSGLPIRIEKDYVHQNGLRLPVEVMLHQVRTDSNKVLFHYGLVNSLYQKKSLEQAALRSEVKYRRFFDNAKEMIYVCAGDGRLVDANQTLLDRLGYVRSGIRKLTLDDIYADSEQRDAILAALSVSGFVRDLPVRIRQFESGDLEGVLTAVVYDEPPYRLAGHQAFIQDISENTHIRAELETSLNKLQKAMEDIIHAMASTLEMRDAYTAGHQARVARYADLIAAELDVPESSRQVVRMAAMIHDIGKIYVPAEILSKPGKITDLEYALIKTHPQVGYDILKNIDFPWPIADTVLQHHERLDGSGYPQGLSGDQILPEARIVAIADVVEAMCSHRPYRPALAIRACVKEIVGKSGVWYDPDMVKACCSLIERGAFDSPSKAAE